MGKIFRAILKKIQNESIFQHFSAEIDPDLEFQIFFQKSENDNFFVLWS